MSGGIVRRRVPISSSDKSRTSARALRSRLHAGSDRTALRVNSFCPIQFLDERKSGEKLSVGAVQHIEIAVAIGLHQKLSRLALIVGVDQDGSFCRVVVI